jgi:ElaB/YqjD/DUF883 family membrane-anchored ribosome-binding protein
MKNRNGHHTAESPEQLIHNIQSLMAEVEALVAAPGSVDAETGSKLGQLQEKLSGASEKVQEFYQSARKRVVAGAHQADETIRSHPYQSLAVALGVGVLLGVLIRRSRD